MQGQVDTSMQLYTIVTWLSGVCGCNLQLSAQQRHQQLSLRHFHFDWVTCKSGGGGHVWSALRISPRLILTLSGCLLVIRWSCHPTQIALRSLHSHRLSLAIRASNSHTSHSPPQPHSQPEWGIVFQTSRRPVEAPGPLVPRRTQPPQAVLVVLEVQLQQQMVAR